MTSCIKLSRVSPDTYRQYHLILTGTPGRFKREERQLPDGCECHRTAVAIGALTQYARFIIEYIQLNARDNIMRWFLSISRPHWSPRRWVKNFPGPVENWWKKLDKERRKAIAEIRGKWRQKIRKLYFELPQEGTSKRNNRAGVAGPLELFQLAFGSLGTFRHLGETASKKKGCPSSGLNLKIWRKKDSYPLFVCSRYCFLWSLFDIKYHIVFLHCVSSFNAWRRKVIREKKNKGNNLDMLWRNIPANYAMHCWNKNRMFVFIFCLTTKDKNNETHIHTHTLTHAGHFHMFWENERFNKIKIAFSVRCVALGMRRWVARFMHGFSIFWFSQKFGSKCWKFHLWIQALQTSLFFALKIFFHLLFALQIFFQEKCDTTKMVFSSDKFLLKHGLQILASFQSYFLIQPCTRSTIQIYIW